MCKLLLFHGMYCTVRMRTRIRESDIGKRMAMEIKIEAIINNGVNDGCTIVSLPMYFYEIQVVKEIMISSKKK